jgi:hypothetical protein
MWVLLPLLALVIVRLAWGVESSRRLAATLASLRAQGMRPALEDFPDDASHPGPNALRDLIDALGPMTLASPDQDMLTAISDPTDTIVAVARTPEEWARIDTLGTAHSALIRLLDDMEDRPAATTRSLVRGIDRRTYAFARTRPLSWLLANMALLRHTQGRDAEAVRYLQRMLVVSRIMHHYPSLPGRRESLSVRSMAARTLEAMEPTLDFSTPEARAAAQLMVARFMDDTLIQESQVKCFDDDLYFRLAEIASATQHHQQWWIRPLYEDSLSRLGERYLVFKKAMADTDWYESVLVLDGTLIPGGSNLNLSLHAIEHAFTPYLGRLRDVYERTRADTRAAAIFLALRLHAHRHGSLPGELVALVPADLPYVPADPYTPHLALRYRIDPQGPTIWSRGLDSKDDNAPIPFDTYGNKFRRYGIRIPPSGMPHDIVYGAAWRTAAPPTAPQPGSVPNASPSPATKPS